LVIPTGLFHLFWKNHSDFDRRTISQFSQDQIQKGKQFLFHFTRGQIFIPSQDQISFLSAINFNQELLSSFFQVLSPTHHLQTNLNEQKARQIAELEDEIKCYKQNQQRLEQMINELQRENNKLKQNVKNAHRKFEKQQCEIRSQMEKRNQEYLNKT
jgi:septal ring factor EnvC (AmiA/AmiB activator)